MKQRLKQGDDEQKNEAHASSAPDEN